MPSIAGGMESPLDIELMKSGLHPKKQLHLAWGEFLYRYRWEWFVTLTFAEDVGIEAAVKKQRYWCNLLAKEIYGRKWATNGSLYWVSALEYQKNGRIHFHVLIKGVKHSHRLRWMDRWHKMDIFTGFARIEPVKNRRNSGLYVAKYVSKGCEINFSPNLSDITRDLVAQAEGLS